jgi:F-type H+-transporting ATPase subunit alpha
MDEGTRKIIAHGQRIRACLKQGEYSPVAVIDQIMIMIALTGGCFDAVPIDKMVDAEQALAKSSAQISQEVRDRLMSDKALTKEDRAAILKVAVETLKPFQEKS